MILPIRSCAPAMYDHDRVQTHRPFRRVHPSAMAVVSPRKNVLRATLRNEMKAMFRVVRLALLPRPEVSRTWKSSSVQRSYRQNTSRSLSYPDRSRQHIADAVVRWNLDRQGLNRQLGTFAWKDSGTDGQRIRGKERGPGTHCDYGRQFHGGPFFHKRSITIARITRSSKVPGLNAPI